jgi:hypothetical protein
MQSAPETPKAAKPAAFVVYCGACGLAITHPDCCLAWLESPALLIPVVLAPQPSVSGETAAFAQLPRSLN